MAQEDIADVGRPCLENPAPSWNPSALDPVAVGAPAGFHPLQDNDCSGSPTGRKGRAFKKFRYQGASARTRVVVGNEELSRLPRRRTE